MASNLFDSFFSISEVAANYKHYHDLTFLDTLILYGNEQFQFLDKIYGKIGDWLNANSSNRSKTYQLLAKPVSELGEYAHYTLFQISILRNFPRLISLFREHLNLKPLANTAFPEQRVLYRSWRPVQVVVYLFKRSQAVDEALLTALIDCGADLSVCYPQSSCYLEGLNVLQAVVMSRAEDPYCAYEGDDKVRKQAKKSYEDARSGALIKKDDKGAVDFEAILTNAFTDAYSVTASFLTYGKFSSATLKKLLDVSLPHDINYACQLKTSKHDGMTALHIVVQQNDFEYAELLLSYRETNYTVTDAKGRRALDLAKYINNNGIIYLLKGTEQRFPAHINDYQKGLKYDSEVNPIFQVTPGDWVVSIIRERNSEHAFLIIEGIELDQINHRIRPTIRLAHLVASCFYGKGKVKTIQEPSEESEESEEWFEYGKQKDKNMLCKLANKTPAVQLTKGMQFFPASDNVSQTKCIAIWNEIKAEVKEDRTYYSAWGRQGFFAISNSSNRGNCIDWARSKYNSLVKPNSQLTADWSMYFITLARGFLNNRFNYVRREQKYYLEDQVFEAKVLIKGILIKQNELTKGQNRLYSAAIALLTYTLVRESHLTSGYADNFYLSLLLAFSVGIASYTFLETFSSSHETIIDEEASAQGFSPS